MEIVTEVFFSCYIWHPEPENFFFLITVHNDWEKTGPKISELSILKNSKYFG